MGGYRGIIDSDTVTLSESTHLASGTEVVVLSVEAARKLAHNQLMRDVGLLVPLVERGSADEQARKQADDRYRREFGVPPPLPLPDFAPVIVDGPPLAETIIEERR